MHGRATLMCHTYNPNGTLTIGLNKMQSKFAFVVCAFKIWQTFTAF